MHHAALLTGLEDQPLLDPKRYPDRIPPVLLSQSHHATASPISDQLLFVQSRPPSLPQLSDASPSDIPMASPRQPPSKFHHLSLAPKTSHCWIPSAALIESLLPPSPQLSTTTGAPDPQPIVAVALTDPLHYPSSPSSPGHPHHVSLLAEALSTRHCFLEKTRLKGVPPSPLLLTATCCRGFFLLPPPHRLIEISIAFPNDGAWKSFHKQLQHFLMEVRNLQESNMRLEQCWRICNIARKKITYSHRSLSFSRCIA